MQPKHEQEGNALYRPMVYCFDCPDIWHIKISYRVPLVEAISSYYMDIFPITISVTRVPLVETINSYDMVIFQI